MLSNFEKLWFSVWCGNGSCSLFSLIFVDHSLFLFVPARFLYLKRSVIIFFCISTIFPTTSDSVLRFYSLMIVWLVEPFVTKTTLHYPKMTFTNFSNWKPIGKNRIQSRQMWSNINNQQKKTDHSYIFYPRKNTKTLKCTK